MTAPTNYGITPEYFHMPHGADNAGALTGLSKQESYYTQNAVNWYRTFPENGRRGLRIVGMDVVDLSVNRLVGAHHNNKKKGTSTNRSLHVAFADVPKDASRAGGSLGSSLGTNLLGAVKNAMNSSTLKAAGRHMGKLGLQNLVNKTVLSNINKAPSVNNPPPTLKAGSNQGTHGLSALLNVATGGRPPSSIVSTPPQVLPPRYTTGGRNSALNTNTVTGAGPTALQLEARRSAGGMNVKRKRHR